MPNKKKTTKTTAKSKKVAPKKTTPKKIVAKGKTKTSTDSNNKPQHRWIAALSYLGILVLVPLFYNSAEDSFLKFHARQGLALLIAEIVVAFVLYFLRIDNSVIGGAIYVLIAILVIIGISNAAQGARKKLPLVGELADALKI